jgi:endonuclease YncB( thermonuclease family)
MHATLPSRSFTLRFGADMKRYQYRPAEPVRSSRRKWLIPTGLASLAMGLVGVATIGVSRDGEKRSSDVEMSLTDIPEREAAPLFQREDLTGSGTQPITRVEFGHCGKIRRTCVVDGDTFWLNGDKIRIADIDTPEVSQPKCASEKALGERATNRLVQLLNEGPFELVAIGGSDEDQYGRKLRVVTRDGRSLGDQLVAEGLARVWTGSREPWC